MNAEIVLDAVKGDDNAWNFDITGDIDAADTISFKAARTKADLATPLISKTRGSGIADVDAPNGKFQVHLLPADTAALTDEALVFSCKVHKADTSTDTTVAEGVIRF